MAGRLEEALDRLERAVARLETVCAPAQPSPAAAAEEREKLRAIADTIATRVDTALAKVGRALGEES
jgi:hypothetical protein